MKGPLMTQGQPPGGMASPQDWLGLLMQRYPGPGLFGDVTQPMGGFRPPPIPTIPQAPPMALPLPVSRPAPRLRYDRGDMGRR